MFYNVYKFMKTESELGITIPHVTMRRFHATTVVVEKRKLLVTWGCVCNLRYPACIAHAPYCLLWPTPALRHFSTSSHKWQEFERKTKLLNTKYVLLDSVQLLSETLFFLRRTEQDMIKNVYWSPSRAPSINLIKLTGNFTYHKI